MKYKIRNPFYKIEKGVEKCNVFAMSIGEEDEAYDNDDVLILVELDEKAGICEYRRFQKPTFNDVNTKYGKIFKVIITDTATSTKIEFKPTKNKKAFDRLDAYHWEHID